MASIGSLGIGSGMDLNGLLDKIAASEQAPLYQIKQRQSEQTSRFSAYGVLQGMLSGMLTASDQLAKPDFMNGFKAASSATAVLGTSSDTTASAGTYAVNVTAIAKAQSMVTAQVATTTGAIGAGGARITIDFGTVDRAINAATGTFDAGAVFTANGAKPAITVDLADGKTSLADIRDAINKAAGGAVSASIINDGTGNRLVLASSATGANATMRVAVADDGSDAQPLNADLQTLLADDPAGTQNLKTTVAAQNAALTVNGVAVTSATNSVAGAIQGVTMTLADVGASTVTVQRDTAGVKGAVTAFVNAYNGLSNKLRDLTAYNAGGNSGVLLGDSTARLVQARLRATVFESHAGAAGDPARLSDIGIAFQKDGTLKIDDAKLSKALADNPTGVTRLFAGNDSGDATGIGRRFAAVIHAFTDDKDGEDRDGALTIAMAGAKKTIANLDKDLARTQDRIDASLAQYRKQFQALDLVVSSMTATSNYLTQQLASLNTSKSK
ncbi:flagellar filament capping protein FliD [Ramlibacter sp.]|uniref:flagellar filament capping protein FliD n=1 Tax=Ramlibacter sp. TaxID=1917967 RepID=UPI002B6678DA|nr:flagellar filament capping protein FliD [Ramlibacter sp.]HWI83370.1 flagellar filament capping protein FliD [Ramlibacter sp.]